MSKQSIKKTGKKEFVGVVTNKDEFVSDVDLHSRYSLKDSDGNSTSPTNQIAKDSFSDNYGSMGLKRPLYNPKQLAGLLEINTFHKRCTKTKSQDTAGTGYKFIPLTDNPSEEEKERLEELFDDQFPPFTTQLVKKEIDYQSIGYGFLELVKEGNLSDTYYKYINHVPAHTIRVHRSRQKYCQIRGTEKVWFKHPSLEKDVHKDTGQEYDLGTLSPNKRANDMIMEMDYTPRSDFYGVPDIVDALGAILGNISQREYNNAFFKNHGIPNYAVYITGDYDLETDEEGNYKVVQYIQQYLNKVRENPHSSMVFGIPSGMNGDVKVHFEELAVNQKDASFRMYRKDNRDEIVISHGVPPYRIGLSETGSLGGNTAKESNEIYKESILSPRQQEIEDYLNKYVLKDNLEIKDWKLSLNPLDIDSIEQDRETLGFLFKNGGASPNDLIKNLGKDYGIEPDEDNPALNAHYINGRPITHQAELNEGSGENQFVRQANKYNKPENIEQLFRAMKDSLSYNGKKRSDK